MEILNEYYNIIKEGSQITIKSYGNNDNIIAFYNFEEKEGNIAKDMITAREYTSFKRWLKGLIIHRSIKISEEFIKTLKDGIKVQIPMEN